MVLLVFHRDASIGHFLRDVHVLCHLVIILNCAEFRNDNEGKNKKYNKNQKKKKMQVVFHSSSLLFCLSIWEWEPRAKGWYCPTWCSRIHICTVSVMFIIWILATIHTLSNANSIISPPWHYLSESPGSSASLLFKLFYWDCDVPLVSETRPIVPCSVALGSVCGLHSQHVVWFSVWCRHLFWPVGVALTGGLLGFFQFDARANSRFGEQARITWLNTRQQ